MIRRSSGIPAPAHAARIYKVEGNQALVAGTAAAVPLTGIAYRSGSYVSTATASALVATTPGIYLATAKLWYAGGTSGEKYVSVLVNGAPQEDFSLVTATAFRLGGSVLLRLVAADAVTVSAFSAVAATISGFVAKDCSLSLEYVGPLG